MLKEALAASAVVEAQCADSERVEALASELAAKP
jgi:hypothetical protein